MADLFWPGGFQFFDDNGNPLNAGTIAFYDAGTSNPRTMYRDSAETGGTAWGTSLTLNSAGRLTDAVYFPTGAWKYILSTSGAVIIRTEDNIPGAIPTSDATFARPDIPILTKATNYSVVVGDLGKKINVDATGGDVTITLLSAITAGDGGYLAVQNVGATGTVTIATSGGQTINGASAIKLRAKDDAAEFVADGANWTAMVSAEIRTVSAKSADYTITQADFGRTVTFDATAAARTATLPAAATVGSGFWVRIAKIDSSSNAVTVDGNASETIAGATTYALPAQYSFVTIQSDGSNWNVINLAGQASTTTKGFVELATEAETAARTDNTTAVTPFSSALPRGFLHGLTLANNATDATNDIDIGFGMARDANDGVNIILTAGITKRLDAAWAVGDGNGGLDTGAIANTVYHVFLIKRSDTGVVDALFSTSASSPTMPTNYTHHRRIGSVIRIAGALLAFTQIGDEFLRKVPISASDVSTGTSAVLYTLSVPVGIRVEAIVSVILAATDIFDSTAYLLVTSPDQTDTAASSSLYDLAVFSEATGNIFGHAASRMRVRTNTSAQIRYRASATSAELAVRITQHGWIDTRGRLV